MREYRLGIGSLRLTGTLSRCTWHLFSRRTRREDREIVDKVRGQLANLWDIDPTHTRYRGDGLQRRPADGPLEQTDRVWQVQTNLDDVAPEVLGYCFDRLFREGVLDVFTQPIQMKKNRPGVLLTVLCGDEDLSNVERILFEETGTFGLRKSRLERSKLKRRLVEVHTRWGSVRGKLGWNGSCRILAPEYEDCVRVAQGQGIPLRAVYQETARRLQEEFESPGSSER